MVRAVTATAVRASISTPVLPVLSTVAVMSMVLEAASGLNSIDTLPMRIGWQRGISPGVFLAAMRPALIPLCHREDITFGGAAAFDDLKGGRLHSHQTFGY